MLLNEADSKYLELAAKQKGHRVRHQVDDDGPRETRTKVRWADMVVATGELGENAVGALYLAFDLKKDVCIVGEVVPVWASRYWRTQTVEQWARVLPEIPQQAELFT